MARGVNKVILVGNLGADPIVRYTPDNKAVASLSLATSESWKDKEGQTQEQTEWHKIVFFGRLGEIAGEYLKKGSKIYVEGKLKTSKWQDKEGHDRYKTEIVGDSMQMLDSKGSTSSDSEPSDFGEEGYSKSAPARKEQSKQAMPQETFDDDVPF